MNLEFGIDRPVYYIIAVINFKVCNILNSCSMKHHIMYMYIMYINGLFVSLYYTVCV